MTGKKALLLAICAGASPAFAHGIDGVVHALAIAGAAVGIVGGLVTAARRVKIALGLGTSLGLLIIGGMLFMLAGVRQLADPLTEIGAMLLLLGMFAAVPLIVAFFVVFGLFSWVRSALSRRKESGERTA